MSVLNRNLKSTQLDAKSSDLEWKPMLSPPSFLKQLAEAVFQHILSTPHKEAFI